MFKLRQKSSSFFTFEGYRHLQSLQELGNKISINNDPILTFSVYIKKSAPFPASCKNINRGIIMSAQQEEEKGKLPTLELGRGDETIPRLLWLQQTPKRIPRIDEPTPDRLYGTDIQYQDVLFLCSYVDVGRCTVTFENVPPPERGKCWWLVFDMGYDYNVYGTITVAGGAFHEKVNDLVPNFEGRESWGRVLPLPISVEADGFLDVTFSFAFRARAGDQCGFSFVFPALGGDAKTRVAMKEAKTIQPGSFEVSGLPVNKVLALEGGDSLKRHDFDGTLKRALQGGGMIVGFQWNEAFLSVTQHEEETREPMVHVLCLDNEMWLTLEYDPQFHAMMAMSQLFDRIPVNDTVYLCKLKGESDPPKMAKVCAESSSKFEKMCRQVVRGDRKGNVDIDGQWKREGKKVIVWEFGVLRKRFDDLEKALTTDDRSIDIKFIKVACDDSDEAGKEGMTTFLPRGRPLTQAYRTLIWQVLNLEKEIRWEKENEMISKFSSVCPIEDKEQVDDLLRRMEEHQCILEWEEQLTQFPFSEMSIIDLAKEKDVESGVLTAGSQENSCKLELSPTFGHEKTEKPFSRFIELEFCDDKHSVKPVIRGSKRAMYQYAHWRGKDAITTMAGYILPIDAKDEKQLKYYAVPTAPDQEIRMRWERTRLNEIEWKDETNLKLKCLEKLPAHWLPDYDRILESLSDASSRGGTVQSSTEDASHE